MSETRQTEELTSTEEFVDHPGTITVPDDGVIVVIVKADGQVDRYVREDISHEEFVQLLRELADVEEADLNE